MPHRDIHLDFNESIANSTLQGINESEIAGITDNFVQVHRGITAMHGMGQVQFMNLPYLDDTLQRVAQEGEALRQQFDYMVVLGIGGSGLGAKAIQQAAQGPLMPGMPLDGKKGLYILDTVDPDHVNHVLHALDLNRTVFNVVSKSGNTVETMAQFLIVHDLLKTKLGSEAFRKHIVMTTDAQKGALRRICQEEGFKSFEILPGVGGRFSVLSPVGLLPAAFLGVSVYEMAEGAIRMDKRCKVQDLWTNPAGMLAVVTYLLAEKHGRKQLVTFNYDENLQAAAEWFRQLWAESLGKRTDLTGKEVRSGITPVMAVGPRDQHSQMQLYVEGPQDKMVMFWVQEKFNADFKIPNLYPDLDSLAYLGNKELSEVLLAEQLATERALSESGVPSFRLELYERDAYALGQLFYLLEMATAYAGGFYNVNPYDQPGVELGKKYLYGKLGRDSYQEFGATLARTIKDKRYVV